MLETPSQPAHAAERGFALVTVLMLAAMLSALLGAYFVVTRMGLAMTRSSMDATRGFYAAEAGLNIRAKEIRERFEGFGLPSGTVPVPTSGQPPCWTGTTGSGDFQCETFDFQGRDVLTYVAEEPGNPRTIVVPPGQTYQNLSAQEYLYSVNSTAMYGTNRTEAILAMRFGSRLVPMFQFAAFYDKDLEILPGPSMTLSGPVHVNGDLYMVTFGTLTVRGQITTTGTIYRGRKHEADPANQCAPGLVRSLDHTSSLVAFPACGPGRVEVLDVAPWGGMVETHVDHVTVPPPEVLDPVPGELYWDRADLRIMLDLDASPPEIKVYNADGSEDGTSTTYLTTGCSAGKSPVGLTLDAFRNHRENLQMQVLEIDVRDLLDCIELDPNVQGGASLDDATDGGLVWYLGVKGPDQDTFNNYGVRVANGAELAATVGTTEVNGLTIVTDQAVYIHGDYNSTNKKPAAFLADSLNILSNAWSDANDELPLWPPLANPAAPTRAAADTTINAAFLAGTDTTGGPTGEGPAGQNLGDYNGGLENFPRLHENWTDRRLRYLGSFVSLDRPRHVDGHWSAQSYIAPIRDWGFDTDFQDPANLPPLSPRFVYVRQELFSREFEF